MLGGFLQRAFDWLDTPVIASAQQPAPEPSPKPPLDKTLATTERPKSNPNQRQVSLNGQVIAYQLERSKRRSVGLIVGSHGLAVRAPKWTPIYEIEAFIHEKTTWILKKLFEAEQRQAHSHKAQMVWQEGAAIDYLGESYALHLGALYTTIDTSQSRIWLALPATATAKQIQETTESAIQRAALLLFETRLNHFAPQLKVQWSSVKLSNAGGRWGSAKSDGTIRLNWRLMHFRLPVIDYVVVHELSHLRHMDHSPRFWDTVESIMPDYATLKKELTPV
jgi:predicted metal-dependent hydrolase